MSEAQEQANIIPEDAPIPEIIPLMPIREAVYFPHAIFPIFVGRDKSVRALEEARCQDRYILLVAQKENVDDPQPEDLFEIGTVAEIMQVLNLPDNTVRVMLEGNARVRILEYLQSEPFYRVRIELLTEEEEKSVEAEALMRSVVAQFQQVVELGKNVPPESLIQVMNIDEPGRLADTIVPFIPLKVEAKQEILETIGARERLEKLSVILKKETEILEIQKNIRNKVEKEMGDTQREFILREQLKAIQQELGERDERTSEIEEYRTKIEQAAMPEEVQERSLKELDRLEKMPFAAPEGVVVRTYLDWLVALPWRILQGIKTAGFRNPVFMLDEIDKIGIDFRGDPSAALLEALDPEQNNAFSDHYLEVPFDLSDVMFITTANLLDPVPPALKDRMEVIPFPGYIEEEKLNIARDFLVVKQRKEHGLKDEQLIVEEDALRKVIREYTREAGVRNLEREVATICRKTAKEVASGKEEPTDVAEADVKKFLGP